MTKPFPYQRRAVRKVRKLKGRALVAADPGTGKSFISILHAMREEIRPVVVICPASIRENWSREIAVHAGWSAQILSGTRPERYDGLHNPRVVIVNYDILGQRQGDNTGSGWLDWLIRLKPQMIVIDECQACGSARSKRTNWVRDLCQDVPNVVALSGTPLVNRPGELFPILNILRPDAFPSWWKFARRYCAPRLAPWGWVYTGASHLEELHQLMQETCMIRIRKKEVLKDLPAKRRIVVPLPIERPEEYAEAVDKYLVWVEKNYGPDRRRKASKAQQITQLSALRQLAARLKLKAVIEWADNFLAESGGKLPMFGIHSEVIEGLEKHFGRSCVVVTGGTAAVKRQGLFDSFNKSKKIRVLIGNIDAAGVGWNCTASSDPCLFEIPWAPGRIIQVEDRCHGIKRGIKGQRVTTRLLVAAGTIEEKLLEINQKKSRNIVKVLDGKAGGETVDVYDLLTQSLKESRK